MSASTRWVIFALGCVASLAVSLHYLGPPPPTQRYELEDGMFFTVHSNWDWPLTPAWVAAAVAAAFWAMVSGLAAVFSGQLREACRWRNTTIGLSLGALVFGLSGGLSQMFWGMKGLEQLGSMANAQDVVREMKRGAVLEWWGVAGVALGGCFALALHLVRGIAIRRRATHPHPQPARGGEGPACRNPGQP